MSRKRIQRSPSLKAFAWPASAAAALALASQAALATTVIGDLNNFDTLNDTGQTCYGFEIEIDDVRATDITYTFDWNHYGAPKIREDLSDLAHPKVFVRYESTWDPVGQTWGAPNGVTNTPSFTNTASPTTTPPAGHTCTDTSVNEGCEHFGVGYYGVPSRIVYNWLVDGGAGTLVYFGSPVSIATPNWTYTPPAAGVPAQVVAAIPAPVVPIPAQQKFGEPTWVKVVKTTSHNAQPIALAQLISDDADGDQLADWTNGEPDEVETEWKLLQTNNDGNAAKAELEGAPDDMGAEGNETVTRRYEFYAYAAAADTLDGETGEAMCSEVDPAVDPSDPAYLHGLGDQVAVTDANGDTYYVDCSAQVVVGNYIGAQMAGFDAAAALGLVDHLQDGDTTQAYTPRTVVVGGNSPYSITLTPADGLPPGMTLGDYTDPDSGEAHPGVLYGWPTQPGSYVFTVDATDADGSVASRNYTLLVGGPAPQQWTLNVSTTGNGTVTGSGGIDCGSTCSATFDDGSQATLSATPGTDSLFAGWSGACTGTAACEIAMSADTSVSARFDKKQFTLSVGKTGSGSGTVAGNGIDCGTTCSTTLEIGTAVALSATASPGSVFTGWSGACSGTGSCSFTLDADSTVTADFAPAPPPPATYTLSVGVSGQGSVSSKPKGINCGKQCTASFASGSSVTLTAKAKGKNHPFTGWSGACAGNASSCTVPMTENRSVTATFR